MCRWLNKRIGLISLSLLATGASSLGWLSWREAQRAKTSQALIAAMVQDNIAAAPTALRAGADPNVREGLEEPPSFWRRLFDKLRGRNLPLPHGSTSLHLAMRDSYDLENGRMIDVVPAENPTLISALLDQGADPNARDGDNYDNTPLMLAAWYGYRRIAALLQSHGAHINAKNSEGWTPLMHAAWTGQTEMVKFLLQRGADVHRKGKDVKPLSPAHS